VIVGKVISFVLSFLSLFSPRLPLSGATKTHLTCLACSTVAPTRVRRPSALLVFATLDAVAGAVCLPNSGGLTTVRLMVSAADRPADAVLL
jgi:hypothetical protein